MNELSNRSKIGVVGTGRMGANMALRLNDCGWNVEAVYDSDPANANTVAVDVAAVIPATLADVTDLCDAVITVVSDDSAMESIFSEQGDSLLSNAQGKIFINCATVTPAVHLEIERRAKNTDAMSLEACMAGSIPQARDGKLMLICGGEKEAFDRVKPLLDVLGSAVIYVGGAGTAAQVKALVNMVMNINTAGLAEGLGLGEALGLDLTMLREVFSKTGAASRVLETDGADMQAREHDVYFSCAHAAKDSHIALGLAAGAGLNLPLAAATAAQYDRTIAEGFGDLDKSAVAELTFKGRRASPTDARRPSTSSG